MYISRDLWNKLLLELTINITVYDVFILCTLHIIKQIMI